MYTNANGTHRIGVPIAAVRPKLGLLRVGLLRCRQHKELGRIGRKQSLIVVESGRLLLEGGESLLEAFERGQGLLRACFDVD